MSYYQIPLKAGIPYRFDCAGRLILIDSTGAASGVDVTLVKNGTPGVTMPDRKTAFRYVADYEGVIVQTAVDATVGLFLTFNDVQLGWADGAAVSVPGGVLVTNTGAERVPVDVGGAVIEVTATNVGINNTDAEAVPVVPKIGAVFTAHIDNLDADAVPVQQKAGTVFTTKNEQLATITDFAPVAIGIAAAALVSDATQKRLRIRNSHATAVIGIGGAGVTMANAAIQLQPGDIWMEEDAAGAAWYAISDTAATTVQLQGIK